MKAKFGLLVGAIISLVMLLCAAFGAFGNPGAVGEVYAIDPYETILFIRSIATGQNPGAAALIKDGMEPIVLIGSYSKFGLGGNNVGLICLRGCPAGLAEFIKLARNGNLVSPHTAQSFIDAMIADGWKKVHPSELPPEILAPITGSVEQALQYAVAARFMLVVLPVVDDGEIREFVFGEKEDL